MAYSGGIDYYEIRFGGVGWETREVRSPWQRTDARTTGHGNDEIVELEATAREFSGKRSADDKVSIVYDVTGMTDRAVSGVMCVVFGRAKGDGPLGSRQHYVLLVAPKGLSRARTYERIGVGEMPGRLIDFTKPGLDIKIQ
jgi:hypothetical protein